MRVNKTFNPNDAARGNSHPYHLFKKLDDNPVNSHNHVPDLMSHIHTGVAFITGSQTSVNMQRFSHDNSI